MKLLVVETSTRACSVAAQDLERRAVRHHETERDHSQLLLPMVDECLAELGMCLADLDAIGFGRGPGSFTGVRIALAAAQGLALSVGAPLVGVSSLAAVAQGAATACGGGRVLVVQDARMNEVYAGGYCMQDGIATAVWPECVCTADQLPDAQDWHLAGDAWVRIEELAECAAGRPVHSAGPNASDMLAMVADSLHRGLADRAEAAQARYLRDNVVRAP